MKNCIIFFWFLLISSVSCAIELKNNPDEVDVYVVPMDDFPEDIAASVANFMAEDMKLWVKASVKLGDLHANKLVGTNQLMMEDVIEKSQKIIRRFGDAKKDTYFLILTTKDINSKQGSLRFLFSGHNKELNTSVVSLHRLMNYSNNNPVFDDLSKIRLYKIMKRAIGEMYYGWKRTTNILDIMYAPIMSLNDLDQIGLEHYEEKPEEGHMYPQKTI